MKKTFAVAVLFMAVIACQQADHIVRQFLNPNRLPSQFFNVDITKDTTLVTTKGAVIKLPKGSLSASSNPVTLEVKEAYTIEDIIAGGLATTSNGQPLSSGGMIYLNAAPEQHVKILQPVAIATPTPFINPNMQLYTGETQQDGSINWTRPQPLPPNPQQKQLDHGKALFQGNCTSCHKIESDLTGPMLGHVTKRLSPYAGDKGMERLYAFTRNSQEVLTYDCYYRSLYESWNKTPMSAFPALSDYDLDAIYGYIENEAYLLNIPPGKPQPPIPQDCIDSCTTYNRLTGTLRQQKKILEKDSVRLVNDIRLDTNAASMADSDTVILPIPKPDLVSPLNNRSLYYQFNITSMGWYNIDILLDDIGATESTLSVQIETDKKASFDVYLAIPSIKLLAPAGQLDQAGRYGFFTKDGRIPLPQGVDAYLFVMGEKDTTLYFTSKYFITSTTQEFTLTLAPVSRQELEQQLAQLTLSDLTMSVKDTKSGIALRKTVKEINKYDRYKPRNCDCDCLLQEPATMPAPAVAK